MALANLSIYYTWKNIKSTYNSNKFEISAPTWNDNFICLMDHILFQTFKIILNLSLKILETITENLPIEIYVNKIKNRLYTRIVISRDIELLGSTEKDVDQDKGGEHVPKLESVEVIVVHCNLVSNNYQQLLTIMYFCIG